MKIPFLKNKNTKKISFYVLVVIAFFALQIAIIFYANSQFKKSLNCSGGTEITNESTYNFLYRIDQRISSMQSELNYLRGYIVSMGK